MIQRLLPLAATLLAHTLRFSERGERIPDRAVVMFWHGKMFAGWYAMRKKKPVALISRSKDGEILGCVLAKWNYKLVRGSSKKGGMEALDEAIAAVRTGSADTLVITPDGPTGPQHSFKRGAFIAAKELNLPLIMLRIQYGAHSTLNSWDKFELPWPFSRIIIIAEEISLKDFPIDDPDVQREWLNALSLQFDN